MEYIKLSQAAEKWGLSTRRVRVLCVEGKIKDVIRKGRIYLIPADAEKPIDGRVLRGKKMQSEFVNLFVEIDRLKDEIKKRRPFTQGELQRLQDEFLVEFTYNSNAIEGNTLTL